MTNDPQPSSCLSPETLALMAAGRLPAAERVQAERHLATCEDCYDVLMALAEPADVTAHGAGATRTPPSSKPIIGRSRAIIVWSSIAASVLLAAFLAPRWLGGPDRELNNAVGALAKSVGSERPSVGRLNGGFAWGTPPAITRGISTRELPLAVQDAVLAVKKLAAAKKTVKTMDALGVAHLVSGDLDASLAALDEAVALDPKNAAARADLAAARLEKWRRSEAPVDATAALDASQYALLLAPKDPVARFNHALSVEALGLTQAAIDSWKAYLAFDGTSKWADEARAHLVKLGAGTAGGLPAETGRDRYLPDLDAAMAAERDPKRLDCLTRGRQALADSRTAFDASRTAESEHFAQTARAAFACGGVPTIEADAQIVWTHYFLGQAAESPALDALVADAKRHGYLRAAGRIQYARGRLADNAARYSAAEDFFADALDEFRQAGDPELVASTSIQVSEISMGFGDAAGTWMHLSEPLQTLSQLAPRRQHMALTGAYLSSRKFGLDGAARFFADTLVAADERGSPDAALLAGAYLMSAGATFQLGDAPAALSRLNAARASQIRITDDALRTQYDAEINELQGTILATTDPAKAIAPLSSAMKTFDESRRPLRRARLLLIRGRAYRAAGDAASAENDWEEGARIFEDQRPDIRDAQQRIDHVDQMWDLFRELISIRAASGERSLGVAERFRGRALLDALSAGQQMTPLSGDAMYEWLPHGVTVIAYAVMPDQLFRWTISRAGVALDPVAIRADALITLVDRYRAAMARNGAADGVDADALALSDALLPKSFEAGTSRVVFLPDGPLFGVPFAALPLRGQPARLVVDQFISSVSPSLTFLKNSAPMASASRALLVAAGDANPAEGLPALPGAEAEIEAIAPIYRDETVLTGVAASPAAVLKGMLAADVVHFAGHAVADSADPSRSRLLASGADGSPVITFDDLRRARLRRGAVIVLAACEAARGPIYHGEGAVGLAYPFLANGASAVVASIWQIDDATPVSLWQSFHARVTAGMPPDAALAESQRIARAHRAPPSMWAAFESVGGLARQ